VCRERKKAKTRVSDGASSSRTTCRAREQRTKDVECQSICPLSFPLPSASASRISHPPRLPSLSADMAVAIHQPSKVVLGWFV
jgi:hypothetical protein